MFLCIDLKSFYASVKCVERGLDPMTTKLVVADPERSEKTICLAISPAMKALGICNRCRVFEICGQKRFPPSNRWLCTNPGRKAFSHFCWSHYNPWSRVMQTDF